MIKSRNYWPLGIILTFAIFISCTVGLIVMASLGRHELVSADYYEQEIRYQKQLEQIKRTTELLSPASIQYDTAHHCIRIGLPQKHVQPQTQGQIYLYRPSAAGLDRIVKLALNTAGNHTIDAADLQPGLWTVRVQWRVEQQEYFYHQQVVVGAKTSLRKAGVIHEGNVNPFELSPGLASVSKTEENSIPQSAVRPPPFLRLSLLGGGTAHYALRPGERARRVKRQKTLLFLPSPVSRSEREKTGDYASVSWSADGAFNIKP